MKLTAEMRRRFIRDSLPRCRVIQTDYGRNWRVESGGTLIAVFKDWSDAVAFARWKATR